MAYFTENSKTVKLPKAYLVDGNKTIKGSKIYLVENGKTSLLWSGSLNLFVAAAGTAGVAHSPDGVTWTLHAITLDGAACSDSVASIAYGKGIFVAAIGQTLAWSADGINFFSNETSITTGGRFYVSSGGGKFVALGNQGTVSPYYSTDGKTWTKCDTSLSSVLPKDNIRPRYENGIWYICKYQLFYWSKDCITWTLVWGTSKVTYYDIVYAFGKWWRIGKNINTATEIAYSTNGTSFTILSGTGSITNGVKSCAYGNDVVAVVGYNASGVEAVYMTSDGTITETTLEIGVLDSTTEALFKVVFHEKFVAVGAYGYIPYSLDGKTWTKAQPLGSGYTFEDICYTVDD